MNNYEERLENARLAIKEADYILIGAGAGLSDSAGFGYSSKRFKNNFSDFIEKYQINDLYTSSFYRFDTQEEYWAYWARYIVVNRDESKVNDVYANLGKLVKDKEYFVLTTNVDFQFQNSFIPQENIFMIQGDYGHIQCSISCHDTVYSNENLILEMLEQTNDCRIPTNLIPKCPKCESNMRVHIHSDSSFIQDQDWNHAFKRFQEFYEIIKDKKVLLMELGVGFSTPEIIRFSFDKFVNQNEEVKMIRINRHFPYSAEDIKYKTISFDEDISKVIHELNKKGDKYV